MRTLGQLRRDCPPEWRWVWNDPHLRMAVGFDVPGVPMDVFGQQPLLEYADIATPTGGTHAWKDTEYRGYYTSSGTVGLRVPAFFSGSPAAHTLVTFTRPDDSGTDGQYCINTGNNNGNDPAIGIQYDAVNGHWSAISNTAAHQGNGLAPAGRWYSVVGQVRVNRKRLWVDGLSVATDTAANNAGSITAVGIHNSWANASVQQYRGTTAAALYFTRYLDPAEIRQFAADPLGPFRVHPRYLDFGLVAAAPPAGPTIPHLFVNGIERGGYGAASLGGLLA